MQFTYFICVWLVCLELKLKCLWNEFQVEHKSLEFCGYWFYLWYVNISPASQIQLNSNRSMVCWLTTTNNCAAKQCPLSPKWVKSKWMHFRKQKHKQSRSQRKYHKICVQFFSWNPMQSEYEEYCNVKTFNIFRLVKLQYNWMPA